ncbi:MAG: DUF4870 domain-containing protein [Gemmatimonadota bacterium]|nr:DUF4870 domain-containing protein [Gemmatimonadota bacterium]
MNQETSEPTPPPPPSGSSSGETTSTGLDPQLAGLLCYILGLITGLIFFLIEKTNRTVRFHAAQSIVFSIAWIVVWVVLGIVGLVLGQISYTLGNLFGIVSLLVWLGLFIVWIVLLVKGYSGEKWKLPVLGDIAERMAASDATA